VLAIGLWALPDEPNPVDQPPTSPDVMQLTEPSVDLGDCPVEDEVLVVTAEEAYGWPAGTPRCVHVDALADFGERRP
jgi:hypothetical protein